MVASDRDRHSMEQVCLISSARYYAIAVLVVYHLRGSTIQVSGQREGVCWSDVSLYVVLL